MDIKDGNETSEYKGKNAVQVITGLVGLAVAFGWLEVDDPEQIIKLALGVIAGLEALYGLYRTIVKSRSGYASFDILPEIEFTDTLEVSEDES